MNAHAFMSRLSILKRSESSSRAFLLPVVSLIAFSSAASASETPADEGSAPVPEASTGAGASPGAGFASAGKRATYASSRWRMTSRHAWRSLPWSLVTTTPAEPYGTHADEMGWGKCGRK